MISYFKIFNPKQHIIDVGDNVKKNQNPNDKYFE